MFLIYLLYIVPLDQGTVYSIYRLVYEHEFDFHLVLGLGLSNLDGTVMWCGSLARAVLFAACANGALAWQRVRDILSLPFLSLSTDVMRGHSSEAGELCPINLASRM